MITYREAREAMEKIATATHVPLAVVEDLFDGRVGGVRFDENGRVITGWTMKRGSHGATTVRDPLGTDPPPKDEQAPPAAYHEDV